MDLVYLFRVLLKRKWLIIGSAVIASTIAFFLTRNEKKFFKSTAQISTGFSISDAIKVNNDFSVWEADTKFNNAIVTFKSPTVTSLIAYKLILHDLTDKTPFRVLSKEQQQSPVYQSVNKAEAKKVFEEKLENMSMLTSYKPEEKKLLAFLDLYGYGHGSISSTLNVYRVERTDYIQIDYLSDNPELSAFVVNTAFQQFLRYYNRVRSTRSQESIDTLRTIMERKKAELDAKNAMLRGEGLVDVALESGSKLDVIAGLEKDLNEEKKRQTQLYYSLRKVNQRLSSLGSPTTQTNTNENSELVILKKLMNDTYAEYVRTGSTDASLLSKYNTYKAQYQNKILNDPGMQPDNSPTGLNRADLMNQKSDLELDIQANTINISNIESRIRTLKGSVSATASKGANVETLIQEVDLANKEYLDAKQKYNDATDISTSSVNNFRQILSGQPAINPEPSKRKMIIGMAGAVACISTILIIIFLTYLDSSIKTPGIFNKTVKLKMISMVNFMNLKKKSIQDIITKKEVEQNAAEKNRNNIFRESIRKLRYEIEHSGKKIFLFTSTKKGVGKTTLIQALSYSMSLSRKKILVIDTNFCNNDLTVQMNAEPVLEKIADYSNLSDHDILDKVKKISSNLDGGSVFAIGSEGGDYTPSEILPKENLLKHLKELTSQFDYIFLEGPPLNDFSDSRELTHYVDGVIAIFSATTNIKQIDKQSISFFKELNGKFYGSVLNKVDLKNVDVS